MEVNGVEMGVDPMMVLDAPPPYKGDVLHLPPSVITNFQDDDSYENIIAEQMDLLWNAFGFDRCFYFNKSKKWNPR